MKMGRPTLYNVEIARKICEHLENGKPLIEIAKFKGYPKQGTVYGWLRGEGACQGADRTDFLNRYTRARKAQSHVYADKSVVIPARLMKKYENQELTNEDIIAITRLCEVQTKTLQWAAARMHPTKYGDHSNQNIKSKVKSEVAITDVGARSKLADKLRKLTTPIDN